MSFIIVKKSDTEKGANVLLIVYIVDMLLKYFF